MTAHRPPDADSDRPWWLIGLVAVGAWLFWRVWTDDAQSQVLATLMRGVGVTIMVTVTAFAGACVLGLGVALAGLSRFLVLRQAARLYTEVLRGIPIIVLLLYVAFVLAPGLVILANRIGAPLGAEPWSTRDLPLIARAVIALMLAYSAFLAEVFRAGIASVDEGQIEAAQALGLTPWHRFRRVVAPQALRTILPPLSNDFVSMVKDSSLVSVLGVADVTQLGKVLAAGNFRYFETYNIVALVYLVLTIGLSLALRALERHLRARSGGGVA